MPISHLIMSTMNSSILYVFKYLLSVSLENKISSKLNIWHLQDHPCSATNSKVLPYYVSINHSLDALRIHVEGQSFRMYPYISRKSRKPLYETGTGAMKTTIIQHSNIIKNSTLFLEKKIAHSTIHPQSILSFQHFSLTTIPHVYDTWRFSKSRVSLLSTLLSRIIEALI